MKNNVRFTFSVGDTTRAVLQLRIEQDKIELVTLHTIFSVVIGGDVGDALRTVTRTTFGRRPTYMLLQSCRCLVDMVHECVSTCQPQNNLPARMPAFYHKFSLLHYSVLHNLLQVSRIFHF